MQRSIRLLLVIAVAVMVATLALVFSTRLRLLPLVLALAAVAITFGGLSLLGGTLTMASIAVLPVLIGLSVDYAVQFQARFEEERTRVSADARAQAAVAAAAAWGPTIVIAALATAAGFVVLLLSPLPMVRGFGALLVAGIVVSLIVCFCAGFAALVRFGGTAARAGGSAPVRGLRSVRESTAAWMRRALALACRRPRRTLALALAFTALGLVLDTRSAVVSDIRELVPADLPALRALTALEHETGASGEINVTVRADDVTTPALIAWMTGFQREVLRAHGYRPGTRCAQAQNPPELCPVLSLTDLWRFTGREGADVRTLLETVPPYLTQGIITRDRSAANLAFGIRLMPLDRQGQVVADIARRLDPPAGATATVAGLPALAAESNHTLASPARRASTLVAALLAVFGVLLVAWRSVRAAALPLIPIALASGWSGAILFVLGRLPGPLAVDLNPMSVTLSALVIAITTEFSVLLSTRYRQERASGHAPERAIERAYETTGLAVLASGLTAIAGFAVLTASNIRMLRDFGVLAAVDLGVSLLGVLLVLPAALLWSERLRPRAGAPTPLTGRDPARGLHPGEETQAAHL